MIVSDIIKFWQNKRKYQSSPKLKENVEINLCLYISRDNGLGIFFTKLKPGIKDCKEGVLYIAPQSAIPSPLPERLSAEAVRDAVLSYFI